MRPWARSPGRVPRRMAHIRGYEAAIRPYDFNDRRQPSDMRREPHEGHHDAKHRTIDLSPASHGSSAGSAGARAYRGRITRDGDRSAHRSNRLHRRIRRIGGRNGRSDTCWHSRRHDRCFPYGRFRRGILHRKGGPMGKVGSIARALVPVLLGLSPDQALAMELGARLTATSVGSTLKRAVRVAGPVWYGRTQTA